MSGMYEINVLICARKDDCLTMVIHTRNINELYANLLQQLISYFENFIFNLFIKKMDKMTDCTNNMLSKGFTLL